MSNEQSNQALTHLPRPVAVFQGYDSVTGGGLSTAVTGQTRTVGGTSSVSYRVCTDLETLSEALEINQSLSVGFGPIGGVDEKMQFLQRLSVTTYSVSIVVFSKHTLGTETMTDVAIKPGITPPQDGAAMGDFFRSYGDSFLSSVTSGGEYYAVYTYYSQTRDEQTQLTLDMKTQGIFEGGSVDASLQTRISNFNSSTKTRTSFDQNMAGIQDPEFPSSDRIISFALAFPSMVLTAPAIIGFETTGYERVPLFGTYQPVARNRDFFVGTQTDDGLTAALVQVQQLANQIAWIRSVYAFYGGLTDMEITNVADQAQADHDKINGMIRAYQSDPTQSFTRPDLPSLTHGTPALSYVVTRSEAHGGPGGDAFDDVDDNTFIPQLTRIATLQLRSGSRINELIVGYQNTGGSWMVGHGSDGGGDLGNQVTLMPGQFVNQIRGRSGARVDHLTLITTNGDQVDGGGNRGDAFDEPLPPGAFLLGFSGRSGAELDQIRFVFGQLVPAQWVARP